MATQVPIPKLGQSEETVSIVKWHKQEGEAVSKGDVLFEVETDKSVLEVESQFEGALLKIVIPAGKEVPVMSIAAVIGEAGEEIPEIKQPETKPTESASAPSTEQPSAPVSSPSSKAAPASSEASAEKIAPAPASESGGRAVSPGKSEQTASSTAQAPRHKASPRARKTAAENLLDVAAVNGSGPGGRVVERDVLAYLESMGEKSRSVTPAAFNLARQLGLTINQLEATGATGRITLEDVRRAEAEKPKAMPKMRQIIAQRLQQSKQSIPHFYVTVKVDITELSAFRRRLKEQGLKLSVNDFILKASAWALKDFPRVNSITEDGVHVRWRGRVNVGMAVNLEDGLVVPVLHNADRMAMDELHAAARLLADKARGQKLTPEEMSGGTFTVSNMGMMDVENFSAIINPGESAILAVSSARPRPAVLEDGQIAVREIMKITLSADHRVIDGVLAARFVNRVKKYLEDVSRWRSETGLK